MLAKEQKMLKNSRETEYEFSKGLRWTHWIRFFCMIVLITTGFYIAYVFISPDVADEPTLFLQAKIRMWHQIFGFVLIGATIFKIYLFFFDRSHAGKLERVSLLDCLSPKIWIAQIKYYLFMGPHPHLRGVYNPLQFVSYIFVYGLLILISLTGLILYVHVYHEGLGGALYNIMRYFEALFGGLANVRVIHHICMWGFLIFVPIHVYMAVFNSIKGKEGAMDAVFSGYKFKKAEH
ncbi:MAG: Ni/Fe-hydrogenase, b-type cytochrome subunit [Campylobacteraceae bacterium]